MVRHLKTTCVRESISLLRCNPNIITSQKIPRIVFVQPGRKIIDQSNARTTVVLNKCFIWTTISASNMLYWDCEKIFAIHFISSNQNQTLNKIYLMIDIVGHQFTFTLLNVSMRKTRSSKCLVISWFKKEKKISISFFGRGSRRDFK